MAIESKATEQGCSAVFSYPKLMINKNGFIVLMTDYGRGTLIKENGPWGLPSIGQYCDGNGVSWVMDDFTDYHGTVTLSNK